MSLPTGIEILSIGDELLLGQTLDTNAYWMANQLFDLGWQPSRVQVVGDVRADLNEALAAATERSRLVLCTGGLGPTVDDLTIETAAAFFGRPLVLHQDWADRMRQMFEAIGRPYASNNEKQARLPEGGVLLPNLGGTAPGCRYDHDGSTFFFFPGVPREMKPMFADYAAPWIRTHLSAPPFQLKKFRVFGIPESTLERRLQPILDGLEADLRSHAAFAYRVQFPEIEVKLLCRAPDGETNRKIVERVEPGLESVLREHLLSRNGQGLTERVAEALQTAGATLAVAESCTGGLLGKLLTDRPGSSAWFVGGAIAYANTAKARLLGVNPADILEHGAVSDPVVRQMAAGIRAELGATLGVALSGIAGPAGGTADRPVGTVHIGLADEGGVTSRRFDLRGNDRVWVRELSAHTALFLIHRYFRTGRDLHAAVHS